MLSGSGLFVLPFSLYYYYPTLAGVLSLHALTCGLLLGQCVGVACVRLAEDSRACVGLLCICDRAGLAGAGRVWCVMVCACGGLNGRIVHVQWTQGNGVPVLYMVLQCNALICVGPWDVGCAYGKIW